MTQRVLVLGGSGYVGRHVARALAAARVGPVVAAARRPPQTSPGIGSLALDATDAERLAAAIRDVDWVVNCVSGDAATLRTSADALARAVAGAPLPPGVVHLSSMAVYGSAEGMVDERTLPVGRLGGYAAAKLGAERALADLPRRVILRPGCIHGRGSPQWSLRIADLLRSGRIGDLGSAGEGHCNLVHIDDVSAAVVAAIGTPEAIGGSFNLAIPDPPTWNGYFAIYARALGLSPAPVPGYRLRLEAIAAPLRVAGQGMRRRAGVGASTKSAAPIPPSLLRLWRQAIVLDSRRAEDVLRIAWIPLEQGVAASADGSDLRECAAG